MPLTKIATISRAVKVGKFLGAGFLNLPTSRGDVKMFHGDHVVEVDYTRPARPGDAQFDPKLGDKQPSVQKQHKFVVPEDAAKALGIFLEESVEDEQERLAREAEEKKEASSTAPPAK